MRRRFILCVLALACVGVLVGPAYASSTTVINFDEFPTTGNLISTEYLAQGVTFVTDNGIVWGGLSNGDPGNWDLEGTNGPQFLGFNGGSYAATANFAENATSVSLDASRSLGSQNGDSFTLQAYCGAALVDSDSFTFGAVNSWTTATVSALCIDSIVISGAGAGFHPFGVDNLVIAFQVYAGTPGEANCHGKTVSALSEQYGGMAAAADALGFASVQELQRDIREHCGAV